jgi:hypothetical protein
MVACISTLNNWAFDDEPGYHYNTSIQRKPCNNKTMVTGKKIESQVTETVLFFRCYRSGQNGATNPNNDAVIKNDSAPLLIVTKPNRSGMERPCINCQQHFCLQRRLRHSYFSYKKHIINNNPSQWWYCVLSWTFVNAFRRCSVF